MYNTGNPIGSRDILDLYDNSENIDHFTNSQLDEHPDRFGTKRLTLAGLIKRSMALRNEINDFSGALTFKPEWSDVPMNVSEGVGGEGGALNLQAGALGNRSEINKITSREALRRTYAEVGLNLVEGSFEASGQVKTTTEVLLQDSTGIAYAWEGVLPKLVNINSTPENSGGIGPGKWQPKASNLLIELLKKDDGASHVGFKHQAPGSRQRVLIERLGEFLSIKDFDTQQDAINAAFGNLYSIFDLEVSVTVNVGPNESCKTIMDGINRLIRTKPLFQNNQQKCKIKLLPGFVMAEQIFVTNGQDLNWIVIESDTPVRIDHTKIVNVLSVEDALIPIFGASNQSVLPTIKTLFYYDSSSTSKDGIAVIEASGVYLHPGAGVQKARNGFKALYGSWGYSYMRGLVLDGGGGGAGGVTGVDFSECKNRALHVAHGSVVGFPRGNFSNSKGDYGVYCIWNSLADLYQSDASGAAGTAFCSRDGSMINCRESCAARSKRGYHALHAGRINARSKQAASAAQWVKDSARNCTEYGILASGCSQIEAAEVDVSDCTGSAGVLAGDASIVSFQLGIANRCTNKGIYAAGTAAIQADGADVSNNPFVGVIAAGSASIALQSASRQVKINDCGYGVVASGACVIDVTGAEILRCDRAVEARDSSVIDARSANLSSAKARGVSCIDGGSVNAISAIILDCVDRAITCRDGGRVAAKAANCDRAGYLSVEVKGGGIVSFHEGVGDKLNVAINTVTTDGIIFR